MKRETANVPSGPISLADDVWAAARKVADTCGVHYLGSIGPEVAALADAIDAYDSHIEAMAKALGGDGSGKTEGQS